MDEKKNKKKKKEQVPPEVQARREAYDWIQSLISALLICVLVFVFVLRIMDVHGTSMFPTLNNGDKVLVSATSSCSKRTATTTTRRWSSAWSPWRATW